MAHNSDYSRIWDPYGTAQGLSVYEISMAASAIEDIGGCCQSPSINKWAKYKPYRSNHLYTSEVDRAAANYGISNIPCYNAHISSMVSDVINGGILNADFGIDFPQGDAFEYRPPIGGVIGSSATPFRYLDFSKVNNSGETKGYNASALPPIGQTEQSSYEYVGGRVDIQFATDGSGSDEYLKLTDLSVPGQPQISLGNFYVNLLLHNSAGDYIIPMRDGSGKVSDLGTYAAHFSTAAALDGAYTAFVFLSETAISEGGVLPSHSICIPLAMTVSDITINGQQEQWDVVVDITAYWVKTGSIVTGLNLTYVFTSRMESDVYIGTLDHLLVCEVMDSSFNTLATFEPSTRVRVPQGQQVNGTITLASGTAAASLFSRGATRLNYTLEGYNAAGTTKIHEFTMTIPVSDNPRV